jgi:hypothetical protein
MDLNIQDFPVSRDHGRFRWAPLLFHPIQFAQDRLTIGLIVTAGRDAHLLEANRLNKLECLFEGHSEAAIFAASVALEAIREQLSTKGVEAIENFDPPVSGVALGTFREAEASDWHSLATRWLEASSPLFERPHMRAPAIYDQEMDLAVVGNPNNVPSLPAPKERLPLLVWEYISEQRPTYARYFNPRVSKPKTRRPSYEVNIDYAGVRVVANFGTLFASRVQSVNTIKRRMWDLSIQMEREAGSMLTREHEMIVQAPAKNDAQISDTQFKNVSDALRVLEEEADTKQIRLLPMTTVQQIGEHILRREAA